MIYNRIVATAEAPRRPRFYLGALDGDAALGLPDGPEFRQHLVGLQMVEKIEYREGRRPFFSSTQVNKI